MSIPVLDDKYSQTVTLESGTRLDGRFDGHKASSFESSVLGFKALDAVFAPIPFLMAALLGFTACCYLGYLTTLKNQFGDIPRFGVYLSPEACFFPTIRQYLAYTRAHFKRGQVLVLIGGSSVLNGVGQSNEELWTKKLQQRLGPNYAVVNLGLRACSTYEGAYFVAEALTKQYDKVIFVTSSLPSLTWNPLGRPPYAYLYWDAKYQNLLQDFPDRDIAIEEKQNTLPCADWTPESLNETKMSQWMNSVFHVSELWNTVGYKYAFNTYTKATGPYSFLARKKLANNNMEAYELFPKPNEEFAKTYFPSLTANLFSWDSTNQRWLPNQSEWQARARTMRTNVTPALKPKMIVVLVHHSPAYCKKYETDRELARDMLAYDTAQKLFRTHGIRSIQCGNGFTPDDFRDSCHLSPTGGAKLAALVEMQVKSIAKQQGYIK